VVGDRARGRGRGRGSEDEEEEEEEEEEKEEEEEQRLREEEKKSSSSSSRRRRSACAHATTRPSSIPYLPTYAMPPYLYSTVSQSLGRRREKAHGHQLPLSHCSPTRRTTPYGWLQGPE
jgi:hypothetical protein